METPRSGQLRSQLGLNSPRVEPSLERELAEFPCDPEDSLSLPAVAVEGPLSEDVSGKGHVLQLQPSVDFTPEKPRRSSLQTAGMKTDQTAPEKDTSGKRVLPPPILIPAKHTTVDVAPDATVTAAVDKEAKRQDTETETKTETEPETEPDSAEPDNVEPDSTEPDKADTEVKTDAAKNETATTEIENETQNEKENENDSSRANRGDALSSLVTQVSREPAKPHETRDDDIEADLSDDNEVAPADVQLYDDANYEEEPPRSAWNFLCGCFTRRSRKAPAQKDTTTKGSTRRRPQTSLPTRSIGEFLHPVSRAQQHRTGSDALLGAPASTELGKPTLVLDLDETLVHSSFKPVREPDFIVKVHIEGTVHNVYVQKRPGAEEFLRACAEHWEVVIFTASLSKYADPLLDKLDTHGVITARLFRESCVLHCGTYVKDLSRMGRSLKRCVILDNSPQSYAFQPYNAVPIDSWFDDRKDRQLYQLIPCLNDLVAKVDDVTRVLDSTRSLNWLLKKFKRVREAGLLDSLAIEADLRLRQERGEASRRNSCSSI